MNAHNRQVDQQLSPGSTDEYAERRPDLTEMHDGIGNGRIEKPTEQRSFNPPLRRSEPMEDDKIETRPVRHQYLFRRPRALQYSYQSQAISVGDEAGTIAVPRAAAVDGEEIQRIMHYSPEGISKHRERLDLFIDLIWVGIVGNLSKVFSSLYFQEGSAGKAVGLFILLFLPAWRIWNFLREFLNNYYMDDVLQRIFIFWILILSVFFGNNIAYFAEEPERIKQILIILYLLIRGSFLFIELVYSIWIPWLRRLITINFIAVSPITGLWLASYYTTGLNSAGAAIAAIGWEYLVPIIMGSPFANRFIPSDYRKETDPDHFKTRMASFFIITVGEGVLVLIKDGPLGIGIHRASTLAIWPLLFYFLLSYLYFNRDRSVKYIPAVRKRGWRTLMWTFFHIPLFASFITLSSSVLFVLQVSDGTEEGTEGETVKGEKTAALVYRAIWNIAGSLALIVLSMTFQALADRPLDPPGTLLLNNRYIRLCSRVIYILVITLIPLKVGVAVTTFLGICGVGLSLVVWWEYIVCLEQPAKFLEPKGLTTLIKEKRIMGRRGR
ncbi:60S ribosomal protein [Venturia nashicola]|uniref:60S ribosomal protein n=1 Tax=Venturia nashicola TaxID=86259 RepID=A0A4Z1PMH1_9PEZI|nr:60S ribosomal protein [Venturia nashicola]